MNVCVYTHIASVT